MSKKILLTISLLIFSLTGGVSYAQIIITIAGNHAAGYTGDGGLATAAELYWPTGVAFDPAGNLYIAGYYNNCIRKVNSSGIISTVAGNGTTGYTGDGGQATNAQLDLPQGVAFDAAGNMYIADYGNSRIRKVNTLGIISTIAGNGNSAYSGDGGQATAAELNGPIALTLDATGNLYIADMYNHRIRMVNTSGIISTVAGNGTGAFSGDGGPATAAEIFMPNGVVVDAFGNLYIGDTQNARVRMVNTVGIISTFAGNGTSYSGDGGLAIAAGIQYPQGLAFDAAGNLYITTAGDEHIRMVNPSGIISTFAGNGTNGYTGDGGPATSAELYNPSGVACDAAGNLFIADYDNNVIREVSMCLLPTPKICMVQVDSLSQNNIIYWDKTSYTADTFYIYRDTANYNYALIGKVPYGSLSMFTDTIRTLYAANGDPNASSWRYKIAYSDTCHGARKISPMSPYHQTLFMINSGSSFIWTQYQIEGQSQPVSGLQNYLFERDNTGIGNYVSIATISASSTLYTDAQYATYQNTANWRVETKWATVCTPTMRVGNNSAQGTITKSRSNVKNNRVNSISNVTANNQVQIYPNPANDELTISLSENCYNCRIEIINLLGETIKNIFVVEMESKITIAEIINGVYFVKVVSNNKVQCIQKLIVQH